MAKATKDDIRDTIAALTVWSFNGLDDDDRRAIHDAVTQRLTVVDEAGRPIMPEGTPASPAGAITEICRGWMEMLDWRRERQQINADLLAACKAALALLTGDGLDGTLGQHHDNPVPTMLRTAVERAEGKV